MVGTRPPRHGHSFIDVHTHELHKFRKHRIVWHSIWIDINTNDGGYLLPVTVDGDRDLAGLIGMSTISLRHLLSPGRMSPLLPLLFLGCSADHRCDLDIEIVNRQPQEARPLRRPAFHSPTAVPCCRRQQRPEMARSIHSAQPCSNGPVNAAKSAGFATRPICSWGPPPPLAGTQRRQMQGQLRRAGLGISGTCRHVTMTRSACNLVAMPSNSVRERIQFLGRPDTAVPAGQKLQ